MKKLMLLSILMINLTSLGGCPGGSWSCNGDGACASMGPGAVCVGSDNFAGFWGADTGCCKAGNGIGCFNDAMCQSGFCDQVLAGSGRSGKCESR